MFSKGTFLRYLFEIESNHKRLVDLYQATANRTADAAVRELITDFLDEMEGETKIIGDLRSTLQGAG